jgi:hypothetical protein
MPSLNSPGFQLYVHLYFYEWLKLDRTFTACFHGCSASCNLIADTVLYYALCYFLAWFSMRGLVKLLKN